MKNKTVIIAFVLMIAAFIVVLALPADKESIEAENRVMSTVPPLDSGTVFSGQFASGFESFIGDSIGFRSFFTRLAKQLEDQKGFGIMVYRVGIKLFVLRIAHEHFHY